MEEPKIATDEELQELKEQNWPPKEAKGKIETWTWDKQDPSHKDVCCMCRGRKDLIKIEGEEHEMCHLCGNKVVICNGCLTAFNKNNIKNGEQ